MIGRRINDRYEILSQLGDGGMAIVYKAKDLILDRLVAVKVLRSEFSRDEEFIRRFHREAESVASLSHPNIVSIYDIGEEEDCYYIVMEYVKGSTLKSVIKHYAPLPFDETIYIMNQILSAIEEAHSFGIVHRDLKPHNILIDENDHIKVTDFGIAVAMTSATITFTNSIMGSAHYLSPEQARGGKATFKSDIYSLGIVLFEMLTGELPFAGNSPVTVALKHLNEQMPRPKSINSDIPQSLENVILKALAKDPIYRYNHVSEMAQDITTALNPNRINEKMIHIPDPEDDEEKTKIISPIPTHDEPKESLQNEEEVKPKETKIPKKKRKVSKIIWISLIIFFVLAGGAVAAFTVIPQLLAVKNVTIPNVVNKPYDTAYEILRNNNFKVKHKSVTDNEVESGKIARQDPTAKSVVKEESVVVLYVSSGPPKEEVKDYTSYDRSTIESLLRDENFKDVKFETVTSDSVPKGRVIDQDPKAGTSVVPEDTVLVFTVSEGPEKIEVPDTTGKTKDQAQAILENKGLKADFKEEFSDTVEQGYVTKQDPAPYKEVEKGATVTVWISKGPEEKPVTDNINIDVNLDPNQEQPSHVKIVYSDASHKDETFVEEDITESKTYMLPVTINPNGEAHYQVIVDDEVRFQDTIKYEDVKQ